MQLTCRREDSSHKFMILFIISRLCWRKNYEFGFLRSRLEARSSVARASFQHSET